MERADAVSLSVIRSGEDFFSRVLKLRTIREICRLNGRKKASFQGIRLGFKSGGRAQGGIMWEGIEGGVGGR